jgi:hypothetical protein
MAGNARKVLPILRQQPVREGDDSPDISGLSKAEGLRMVTIGEDWG